MRDPSEHEPHPEELAADLVAFFRGLGAAARRDYEALAEADRSFGEDVRAERRAAGAGPA
jgi:hypothetical protein